MANETILVVDDSPTDLKLMTAPLRAKGYHIITAENGEDAVQMANSRKPDLIVLDVILPKMNGFQVCRQLKASPDTSHIKILMLTNKTTESDRFWGKKQGADDYMTKPFEDEQLVNSVISLL